MESFNQIKKVHGELLIAGDKSISHRALILSSLNPNPSIIKNLSKGEDVKSTLDCLIKMGADVKKGTDSIIISKNNNAIPPKEPIQLYAGNSGTTTRLLSGILIHQKYGSIVTGDESLSSRPMKRIIEPLTLMGGNIKANDNGMLPLNIYPSDNLHPISYSMDIASAQVKGSVLLSGLHLDGITTVKEKEITRDHTERMLGLKTTYSNGIKNIEVSSKDIPEAGEFFIPGDISSAAFFAVLALLTKGSEIKVSNVSFNPTRTAYLDILKSMGGNIEFVSEKLSYNEPYGDVIIRSSELKNIDIPSEVIPQIIDEIPILSIAGLIAEGTFTIRNARELRYKESDRIKALCHNFKLMNLSVNEFEDGFSVSGFPGKETYTFESFNDHRIAMSFAILSLLLCNGGKVNNFNSVGISNPEFLNQIKYMSK